MTARRLGMLVLVACGAVLLTGCGIRPTAVPVDAGAPASRTACPTPMLMPIAPTPTASPSAAPAATPAAGAKAGPTPSGSPSASPTPGVFGAPSASHCP
ncbi:hypothetical protein ACIQF6_04955 [Kitasatospora sp. NPDC092948]|uniref:hypothetical protein n=1 Tax=Kitasatospora sp. NPDC092948 TaxID=3364088 RepID=UPI0037F2368B